MLLSEHIKQNHGGSNSSFAASITKKGKPVTSSQVARWAKQGCVFINNGVYQKKNK